MTIATTFTDWPRTVPLGAPFSRCSPSLTQLLEACRRRYGCHLLGCYGVRPIRGGDLPSTHSWGAAIDIGYEHSHVTGVREQLIGYLVGWSAEWGISAIHDYVGQRIWRAGRTPDVTEACSTWWRAQRPDASGMGQSWAKWVHVEVSERAWGDVRPERDRGIT